jgi:hypothetical protein
MSWNDDFDNASLDATKFGTATAGTASITEANGKVTIDLGTAVADAGIVYLQNKVDQSKAEFFAHRVRVTSITAGTVGALLRLGNSATAAPVCEANTVYNPKNRIQVTQAQADGKTYLSYMSSTGTYVYWDQANKTWTVTSTGAYSGAIGDWYVVQFVHTTTQWKLVLLDGSGTKTLADTDWVNFSGLQSSYADLWVFWGEIYTSHYALDMESDYFRYGDDAEVVAFFNGRKLAVSDYRVGRAISYNGGQDFIRSPRTAVVQKTAFEAGENITDVKDPFVVQDGSTYYMLCAAYNNASEWAVSCFTSSDGITWSRAGTSAQLAPGGAGSPDDKGCRFPVLIKDENESDPDKRWKIYYAGVATDGTNTGCFATAPSPTGSYTKFGDNPILSVGPTGAFDADHVFPNAFYADNGVLRLFHGGYKDSDAHWQVGEAISTDWETWERVQSTPVIARRSAGTTTITTLAAASVSVTVGSTSEFVAGECVILLDSSDGNPQANRIESIDSGTTLTLCFRSDRVYTNGKLKSLYFGSVSPGAIRKVGATWTQWVVAFQQKDSGGFTVEMTGYGEGTAHDSWTLERLRTPPLPLGSDWDDISAENLQLVHPPTDYTPPHDIAMAVAVPLESLASPWTLYVVQFESDGAAGNIIARVSTLRLEDLAGVAGIDQLPLDAPGGIGRSAALRWSVDLGWLYPVDTLPFGVAGWVCKHRTALFEASGLTSLLHSWNVVKPGVSVLPHIWTVATELTTGEIAHSWDVLTEAGMDLPHLWRVAEPQLVILHGQDIQLPYGRVEQP